VAVRGAVVAQEVLVASFDGGPAAGEVADHRGGDAVDLADRLAAGGGARPGGEPDAERGGQVGFEGGVIGLGSGDGHPVQGASVEGAPLAVGSLDFRGDGDVGVQVRVAGAGVPVLEGGADQAVGLDLGDAPLFHQLLWPLAMLPVNCHCPVVWARAAGAGIATASSVPSDITRVVKEAVATRNLRFMILSPQIEHSLLLRCLTAGDPS
jgi:hypothetical protein